MRIPKTENNILIDACDPYDLQSTVNIAAEKKGKKDSILIPLPVPDPRCKINILGNLSDLVR